MKVHEVLQCYGNLVTYEDVTELGGQDSPPILPAMFAPNDVNFVVADMTGLTEDGLLAVRGHSAKE